VASYAHGKQRRKEPRKKEAEEREAESYRRESNHFAHRAETSRVQAADVLTVYRDGFRVP
jgi:hypothetical protein